MVSSVDGVAAAAGSAHDTRFTWRPPDMKATWHGCCTLPLNSRLAWPSLTWPLRGLIAGHKARFRPPLKRWLVI